MKPKKLLKVKCIENSYSVTADGRNIINMSITIDKFYNVTYYPRQPYYHLIDDNGENITHNKKFFITEQQHRKNQLELIGI
jgi:hypothetical protein